MRRYKWGNAPGDIKRQVDGFLADLHGALRGNVAGAYLYGSLATGHFSPETSDVDFLVVIKRRLAPATKRRVAETLLRHSSRPTEIELSVLAPRDLRPWRHPTTYDFHYGEQYRSRYRRALQSGVWRQWRGPQGRDPDLAANITLARYKSIPLFGRPARLVFPEVPEADFLDASLRDVEWAAERLNERPIYAALNPCRVLAYLETRRHLSREDAGVWALSVVPHRYHAVIRAALEAHRGERPRRISLREALRGFTGYVKDCIAGRMPRARQASAP